MATEMPFPYQNHISSAALVYMRNFPSDGSSLEAQRKPLWRSKKRINMVSSFPFCSPYLAPLLALHDKQKRIKGMTFTRLKV
jgi:hypothetical protein